MKATALIVMLMATTLVVSAANSQDKGGIKNQDESTQKIKELQKEQIATLKEMTEAAAELFRRGAASVDEIYEARTLLFQAELDAAETDADRIKLYEGLVTTMKDYEELAIARKMAARGTHVAVLKVKARRLQAEIALERLKANAAK